MGAFCYTSFSLAEDDCQMWILNTVHSGTCLHRLWNSAKMKSWPDGQTGWETNRTKDRWPECAISERHSCRHVLGRFIASTGALSGRV